MTFLEVARALADKEFLDELWTLSEPKDDDEPVFGRSRATRRLYNRLHLGQMIPTAANNASGQPDDKELIHELRSKLAERRRRQPGWTFLGPAFEHGKLLRGRNGLLVIAQESEYVWPDAGLAGADPSAVIVYWPSLELGAMPNWAWYTGQCDLVQDEQLFRFYVGLNSDRRGAQWSNLMLALDEQGFAFSSKILTADEHNRPDNAVIYCQNVAAAEILRTITEVVPKSARNVKHAGFGVAIDLGISVAYPEAGEDWRGSLGMQRSELIWQVLDQRRGSFSAPDDLHELKYILDSQESRVNSILRHRPATDD